MLDPSSLGPVVDAYNALSPGAQGAVGKVVSSLMLSATQPLKQRAVRWVMGSEEERAVASALRNAIAVALAERKELNDAGLARALSQPPLADFVLELIHEPLREPNVEGLRAALDESIFDLSTVGDDPGALLGDLRRAFEAELRKDPKTRIIYSLNRLDQIAEGVENARQVAERAAGASDRAEQGVRDLKDQVRGLSRGDRWAVVAIEGMLADARKAFLAGELDEAEASLRKQLELVRKTEPADQSRRHHEQTLLLSLAQVAERRGDRPSTRNLFEEARGLGPFVERNRYLAGVLSLNTGRAEEALGLLDPHDGTAEWRVALAIANLETDNRAGFRTIYADEREVEEPDVLLALVRYHARRNEVMQAEHAARRLVIRETSGPTERLCAVEAGVLILELCSVLDDPPPLDWPFWLTTVRNLFADPDAILSGAAPVVRRSVLTRRLEFHRILLEYDAARRDLHALVQASPAEAALIAAFGMPGAEDGEMAVVASAAKDPVYASLIEAHRSIQAGAWSEAARKAASVRSLAEGPLRDTIVSLELECLAEAGTERDDLVRRLGEIEDSITRALVHASVLTTIEGPEAGLAIVEPALREHPQSLRLLRAALGHTRALIGARAEAGEPITEALDQARALADRLVDRLPCPEHHVTRAKVLARAGEFDRARAEIAEVENTGYETEQTTKLHAQFALELRRFGEFAEVTRRYYERFDRSPEMGIEAARAALRVGRFTDAQVLVEPLMRSEQRDIAITAYHVMAFAVEAQSKGIPAGREAAVRILLEGYRQFDGPAPMAGPLYLLASGTKHEGEVHTRIAHDHGSFANLPGVVELPTEEALEMMRKDQEGARVRSQMFNAGVLPFETYVKLGPRSAPYLWFAHRVGRSMMAVSPPRHPGAGGQSGIADAPPQLILDRAALLMLAETGLTDVVLDSPLELALEGTTVDWLIKQEPRIRSDYRPLEHERLRELVAIADSHSRIAWVRDTTVDDGLLERLQPALLWGDAFEIALAARDDALVVEDFMELDNVPEEHRERVVRSADLLFNLLGARHITLSQAAHAEEAAPSAFKTDRPARIIPLDRPFLLALGAFEAWHDAGLLPTLADVVPALVISPIAESDVRGKLTEQEAYRVGLDAVVGLRDRINDAVQQGRIRVLGRPEGGTKVEPGEEEASTNGRPVDPSDPADFARIDRGLRKLTVPAERIYQQAQQSGALVWSDDLATHLYLNPLGPLVHNTLSVELRALAFRLAYPEVQVVGTPDVMDWLERKGQLKREERLRVLADLAQHGRVLVHTPDLLSDAARGTGAEKSDADPTLISYSSLPKLLAGDAVPRFVPAGMEVLAHAIETAWFGSDTGIAEREETVHALLMAARPWLAPEKPYARYAARMFWLFATPRLCVHLDQDVGTLIRTLLEFASSRSTEFEAFLWEVWFAFDTLDHLLEDFPQEVRGVSAEAFAALSQATAEIEVEGRPIAPMPVIRLVAPRLGLEIKEEAYGEGTIDGRPVRFRVHAPDAEERAAQIIEQAVAAQTDAEDAGGPGSLISVQVTAHAVDPEPLTATVSYPVDLLYLLPKLGPEAGRAAMASLADHYAGDGVPEFARMIRRHRDTVVPGDAPTMTAAWEALYRELLDAPWTWMEHDFGRAFILLHGSDFEHLRWMADEPEPWRKGESLSDREMRIRQSLADGESFFQQVQATWGPFKVAALQGLELVRQSDVTVATEETVRVWIRLALWGTDPYRRVVAWLILAELLHARRDLRQMSVGAPEITPAEPDDGYRLDYAGTYGDLLGDLLAEWIRTELAPPVLERVAPETSFGLPHEGPATLDMVADAHALIGRLHAAIARLVFRAVLTEEHFVQARRGQVSSDPGGDLLLLGHRLVGRLFPLIVAQAGDRGAMKVITELERVAVQPPLSEGRSVVGELFQPDAMGVGPGTINPYLALLFAMIETGLERDDEGASGVEQAGTKGDSARPAKEKPFWWTAAVNAALSRLAEREAPAAAVYLSNLATQEGITDRFESLLQEGVEARSRRLLTLQGLGDGHEGG